MHQEEEVMAGATILMMLVIIVHQLVDVMAGEDLLIMKVAVHITMKHCLEFKLKCNSSFYGYNASAESFDISYRKNT
eukprot:1631047-Ditylum_brightwellii.AAC.1